MSKKKDKDLDEALSVLGAPFAFGSNIQASAERQSQNSYRRGPSYSDFSLGDKEKEEPEDKVLVQVQNCLINGDFEGANKIITAFNATSKTGQFFNQHQMNQLVDFLRTFDKYVKSDLDWNYYKASATDNPIEGSADLKRVKVKEDKISALVNDLWKDFNRQNRNG